MQTKLKNKLIIFFSAAVVAVEIFNLFFNVSDAQVAGIIFPRQIDLSAYIVNNENKEIANGEYDVRFAIYSTNREIITLPEGTAIWQETQKIKIENGIIRAYLGSVIPLPSTLSFGSGNYFVGIKIGTDSEMIPRKRIGAVPLAIDALNASSISGATIGTAAGNILQLGTNGKIDIKNLPTGTSGKKLLMAQDVPEGEIEISGSYDYITADGMELTLAQVDLEADVMGILPVASGGTGAATFTSGGVLFGGGSGAITASAILTNGQLLIGDGTGAPTAGTISGTANQVTVTNGAGTITLSLPQNVDTDASVSFGSVALDAQAGLTLNPYGVAAGNTGEFRLGELAANGTNYVGFKSSDSIAANQIWVLPNADGNPNQVLITDGSGNLSWTDSVASDINAVGDVASGAAFTSDGTQGTSLYFYDADGRGQLTLANLSGVQTWTLPNSTGTLITTGDTGTVTGTMILDGTVALTTDTSGDYVAGLTEGNYIDISGAAGEGWSPTVAFDPTELGTVTWYNGTAATDIVWTFDGETNDGTFGYYEDEDAFSFTNSSVGIGTTSPQVPFHLRNDTGATFQTTVDGAGTISLRFLEEASAGVDGSGIHFLYSADNNELQVSSYTNNVFDRTMMTIERGGNVGIGTTSPTYELDVVGDIGLNATLYHNDDTDTYINFTTDKIVARAGGKDLITLLEDDIQDTIELGDDSDVDIKLSAGADGALFVEGSTGNVGIGDNSPIALLTVGTSDAFQVDASGNVTTTGTVEGLTLTAAADGFTVAGGTTSRTLTVTGSDITLTGGGNTLTLTGSASLNQNMLTTSTPTFQTLTLGYNGADGGLTIYSEQGVTDYSANLYTNTAMTSSANFYLPADEPAGTYLLNMTAGGVIGYDSNTYLTAESDTLDTVAGRGATTDVAISLTHVNALTLGLDDVTNTAGYLKMISAGANNYYTTFTAGEQTANATYTLPTAMPAVNGYVLASTTAGVMSWAADADTTYTAAAGGILALTGTEFSVRSGTMTDTKICTYDANAGSPRLVCNTSAGDVGVTYTAGNYLDLIGSEFSFDPTELGTVTWYNGTAATDIVWTFDGETNDGTFGYYEDEDAFSFTNSYVGIGDTTPDGLLDVEPTGAVTAASYGINLSNLTTNATTDGINKYGAYVTSTGAWTGGVGAATNNYGLYVDTVSGADNNYGAYIAGNVGIGDNSPIALLTVGTSDAFQVDASGNVTTTGTVEGLTLTAAADGFTVAGGTTSRTLTVTGSDITLTGGGNTLTLTGSASLNQNMLTTSTPTFQTLTLGYNGADGGLTIYSEQGVTDYSANLYTNTAMTSSANFYLPADEPAGTYLLNMTAGGVIGYDSNTYDNYSSWTMQDGDTTTYTITSADTLQITGGTGITSNFSGDDVLDIAFTSTEVGTTTWYNGTAATDIVWTFDGETNDGTFGYYEDEDAFSFTNSYVGIGDISPDTLLDLLSSAAAATYLSIYNTNAGDYDAGFQLGLTDETPLYTFGIDDSDSDKFKISSGSALGTNDMLVINGSTSVDIGSGTTSMVVDSSGQVGIGITASLTATLHLVNNEASDATSQGLLLHIDNNSFTGNSSTASNNGGGLVITADQAAGTGFDFLAAISDVDGTDDTEFRLRGDGNAYADGAWNASGADYAEYFYTSDKNLASGETVCLDPAQDSKVIRCSRERDSNVIGIVSTNPAFIGNNFIGAEGSLGEIDPNYKLVGLIGQVPAKVTNENGEIKPGDALTPAIKPGYVMKANAEDSTVGVAMESFNRTEGSIKVLISRRNKTVTVEKVEEAVEARIAQMKIEDEVKLLMAGYDSRISGAESLVNTQMQLIASLEEQMNILKQQNQAVIDFAAALETNRLVYRDTSGNVNLLGGRLEAGGLVAGAFTVKVSDEEKRTIGEAVIVSVKIDEDLDGFDDQTLADGKTVEIRTKAVTSTAKIFVTPKNNPEGYIWTEKMTDPNTGEYVGFKILVNSSVSEDVEVDWFIVEEK